MAFSTQLAARHPARRRVRAPSANPSLPAGKLVEMSCSLPAGRSFITMNRAWFCKGKHVTVAPRVCPPHLTPLSLPSAPQKCGVPSAPPHTQLL